MERSDYTTPEIVIIEISTEGVFCYSNTVPGGNQDYTERDFEW